MLNIKARFLKNTKDRIIGLLGRETASAVYIKTRFGIHTFGMKFSIDVLVLDKKFQVRKMRSGLLPNRVYLWPPVYDLIVELPAGFIIKRKIHLGDKIKLTG